MRYRVGKCRLDDCLRNAGLKQSDISVRLKMPRSQVSDYANNRKTMSLQTAYTIANLIDCRISDLYEWIPVKASSRRKRD